MPKENTHLWFARSLTAPSGPASDIRGLREEPLFFYLGSIIPDAFFYHHRARVRRMARVLHGSDPERGRSAPFRLARLAGKSGAMRDKAFVLGYLSHLALDSVFHPVVHVLSGKRKGQATTPETAARHRLVETALDWLVNRSWRYPRIIHPDLGRRVTALQSVAADLGVSGREVRQALSIQHLANRLILRQGTHTVLRVVNFFPLPDLSALLNLCYAQLEQEPAFAANAGRGCGSSKTDAALLAVRRIKWSRLFAESRTRAADMFTAFEEYWRRDYPEHALADVLPDEYWRGELPEHALADVLPGRACD